MQIKAILKFHLTQAEWQSLRKVITNGVKDVDKNESLYTASENVN